MLERQAAYTAAARSGHVRASGLPASGKVIGRERRPGVAAIARDQPPTQPDELRLQRHVPGHERARQSDQLFAGQFLQAGRPGA